MKINIIAVGNKMPSWITSGWQEYSKRLATYTKINLIEIPLTKRVNNYSIDAIKKTESDLILNKINNLNNYIITLDLTGTILSTEQLANKLDKITLNHSISNISFIIGGPDGLDKSCLNKSDYVLSLSNLTFPHPLVRIILIEQLYRAFAYLNNHPYHK